MAFGPLGVELIALVVPSPLDVASILDVVIGVVVRAVVVGDPWAVIEIDGVEYAVAVTFGNEKQSTWLMIASLPGNIISAQ